MKQLHVHLLFLLTIAITIIFACHKKAQISDSWPVENEIYAHDGSVFSVKKCRKDTLCFRLKATQPDYPPFFSSGTMYWNGDTMFFRHWGGLQFDPLFILEKNLDDSICVEQTISFSNNFMQDDYVLKDTLDLLVVKKDTFTISNDLIHVFDIRRGENLDYRVILSENKGIMGLWTVYPGSDEFEGLRISHGLGWLPEGLHLSRY